MQNANLCSNMLLSEEQYVLVPAWLQILSIHKVIKINQLTFPIPMIQIIWLAYIFHNGFKKTCFIFKCIQTAQSLAIMGHLTQGYWEPRKKEEMKDLRQKMTYTSVLSQSSAAQSGSLKNAALFNATFVNISPLTILTALSLKGNNSTH